jgi:hypothetical protein
MIIIIYPPKARVYCLHKEKVQVCDVRNRSIQIRGRHRIKNGETGYQCEQHGCRMKVCSDHWEEHKENHVLEKLAK